MTQPHRLQLPASTQLHGSASKKANDNPDMSSQSHGVPGQTPCLESESLLQGHGSVMISHRGAIYRLQTTRQGKLILTK